MDTTVSGSSITFEYSQLGLFAIVYGDNSNNEMEQLQNMKKVTLITAEK